MRWFLSVEELKDVFGGIIDICDIFDFNRIVEDFCGGFVVVDNEGKIVMFYEMVCEYFIGKVLFEGFG